MRNSDEPLIPALSNENLTLSDIQADDISEMKIYDMLCKNLWSIKHPNIELADKRLETKETSEKPSKIK